MKQQQVLNNQNAKNDQEFSKFKIDQKKIEKLIHEHRNLAARYVSGYFSFARSSSYAQYRYFTPVYVYYSPVFGSYGQYMLVFNYYYNGYDEIQVAQRATVVTSTASYIGAIVGSIISFCFFLILIILIVRCCRQRYREPEVVEVVEVRQDVYIDQNPPVVYPDGYNANTPPPLYPPGMQPSYPPGTNPQYAQGMPVNIPPVYQNQQYPPGTYPVQPQTQSNYNGQQFPQYSNFQPQVQQPVQQINSYPPQPQNAYY